MAIHSQFAQMCHEYAQFVMWMLLSNLSGRETNYIVSLSPQLVRGSIVSGR